MSKRFATLLLTALPLAAFAHTGHGDHGFIDGLTHPFLGLDHLLAMLLVGVWSVLHSKTARRSGWRQPPSSRCSRRVLHSASTASSCRNWSRSSPPRCWRSA